MERPSLTLNGQFLIETFKLDSRQSTRDFAQICHIFNCPRICLANWENLQREFWSLMRFRLKIDHIFPPSTPRHVNISYLYKILTFDEKFVWHVNRKRHWLSQNEKSVPIPNSELHLHKSLLYVWWNRKKPLWSSGTWKDYHCRYLLPVTWLGKWSITPKVFCFDIQKDILQQYNARILSTK